jgi:hypothetical protein
MTGLAAAKNVTNHEAYQLISVAGNVAITQLLTGRCTEST